MLLEMIRQFNPEHYEFEAGTLEFPMQKLELNLKKEEERRGSFFITSKLAKRVSGKIFSSNYRMQCLSPDFNATYIELSYVFDSKGMEEGDALKGEFCIASNLGEFYLPFMVTIEYEVLDSSMGPIKNLFHFANLAKANWQEAVSLFYSPKFVSVFSGNDKPFFCLYQGLSKHMVNEQNLEEFLLAVKKKQPVTYILDHSEMVFERAFIANKKTIGIEKNGWGYIKLYLTTESDFIQLEKNLLREEDFTGNQCEIVYYILEDKLHAGNNFGKIKIQNSYVSMEYEVTVQNNKSLSVSYTYKREMKALSLQVVEGCMNYYTQKTTKSVWIADSERIIEKMNVIDNRDIVSRLFQAYLLLAQEKYNEAQWILNHIDDLFLASGVTEKEKEEYCFFLYLTTLFDCSEETRQTVVNEVHDYFRNFPESGKILWVLLKMDKEYNSNPVKRFLLIEEQFYRGVNSPRLYVEAYKIIKESTVYLTKLGGFEIALLNFMRKYNLLNQELVSQITYLAGKVKVYNPVLFRILVSCYEFNEQNETLSVICTLLMKGNKTGTFYGTWFEQAIRKEIRITRLYEYYMLCVDIKSMTKLPKMVYMYFSYESDLDYVRMAALYCNVYEHRSEIPELYQVYKEKIEKFVYQQVLLHHINVNLAFLYQTFITEKMVDEKFAQSLADIIFIHQIELEEDVIKNVVIIQDQLKNEMLYPVINRKAFVPIYTNEFHVLLEDGTGNRYSISRNYGMKKLLLTGKLSKLVKQYVTEHLGYQLYYFELQNSYNHIEEETLGQFERLYQSIFICDNLKKNIREKLANYYHEKDKDQQLDALLDELVFTKMDQKERGDMILFLVIRDKYEMAYQAIKTYGFEGIAPKALIRICSNRIDENLEYDLVILELASYLFFYGKYDERILSYLVKYYNGTVKKMRDIWNAAVSFDVEAKEISERIIVQLLFSNAYVSSKQEIFDYYYKRGAQERIALSYLSHNAYAYFVKDKIIEREIFINMEDVLMQGAVLNDICKIAYIDHYAKNMENLTDLQKGILKKMITELMEKNIFFPFFLMFTDIVSYLKLFEDMTFVEYRAEKPGSKVVIHYVIERKDEKTSEYIMEEMKEVYDGFYLKKFDLFFGERLQYYISEGNEEKEMLSESGELEKSDIVSTECEKRYDILNDIVVSQTLQDYDTVDIMMEEYSKKAFIAEKMFTIL